MQTDNSYTRSKRSDAYHLKVRIRMASRFLWEAAQLLEPVRSSVHLSGQYELDLLVAILQLCTKNLSLDFLLADVPLRQYWIQLGYAAKNSGRKTIADLAFQKAMQIDSTSSLPLLEVCESLPSNPSQKFKLYDKRTLDRLGIHPDILVGSSDGVEPSFLHMNHIQGSVSEKFSSTSWRALLEAYKWVYNCIINSERYSVYFDDDGKESTGVNSARTEYDTAFWGKLTELIKFVEPLYVLDTEDTAYRENDKEIDDRSNKKNLPYFCHPFSTFPPDGLLDQEDGTARNYLCQLVGCTKDSYSHANFVASDTDNRSFGSSLINSNVIEKLINLSSDTDGSAEPLLHSDSLPESPPNRHTIDDANGKIQQLTQYFTASMLAGVWTDDINAIERFRTRLQNFAWSEGNLSLSLFLCSSGIEDLLIILGKGFAQPLSLLDSNSAVEAKLSEALLVELMSSKDVSNIANLWRELSFSVSSHSMHPHRFYHYPNSLEYWNSFSSLTQCVAAQLESSDHLLVTAECHIHSAWRAALRHLNSSTDSSGLMRSLFDCSQDARATRRWLRAVSRLRPEVMEENSVTEIGEKAKADLIGSCSILQELVCSYPVVYLASTLCNELIYKGQTKDAFGYSSEEDTWTFDFGLVLAGSRKLLPKLLELSERVQFFCAKYNAALGYVKVAMRLMEGLMALRRAFVLVTQTLKIEQNSQPPRMHCWPDIVVDLETIGNCRELAATGEDSPDKESFQRKSLEKSAGSIQERYVLVPIEVISEIMQLQRLPELQYRETTVPTDRISTKPTIEAVEEFSKSLITNGLINGTYLERKSPKESNEIPTPKACLEYTEQVIDILKYFLDEGSLYADDLMKNWGKRTLDALFGSATSRNRYFEKFYNSFRDTWSRYQKDAQYHAVSLANCCVKEMNAELPQKDSHNKFNMVNTGDKESGETGDSQFIYESIQRNQIQLMPLNYFRDTIWPLRCFGAELEAQEQLYKHSSFPINLVRVHKRQLEGTYLVDAEKFKSSATIPDLRKEESGFLSGLLPSGQEAILRSLKRKKWTNLAKTCSDEASKPDIKGKAYGKVLPSTIEQVTDLHSSLKNRRPRISSIVTSFCEVMNDHLSNINGLLYAASNILDICRCFVNRFDQNEFGRALGENLRMQSESLHRFRVQFLGEILRNSLLESSRYGVDVGFRRFIVYIFQLFCGAANNMEENHGPLSCFQYEENCHIREALLDFYEYAASSRLFPLCIHSMLLLKKFGEVTSIFQLLVKEMSPGLLHASDQERDKLWLLRGFFILLDSDDIYEPDGTLAELYKCLKQRNFEALNPSTSQRQTITDFLARWSWVFFEQAKANGSWFDRLQQLVALQLQRNCIDISRLGKSINGKKEESEKGTYLSRFLKDWNRLNSPSNAKAFRGNRQDGQFSKRTLLWSLWNILLPVSAEVKDKSERFDEQLFKELHCEEENVNESGRNSFVPQFRQMYFLTMGFVAVQTYLGGETSKTSPAGVLAAARASAHKKLSETQSNADGIMRPHWLIESIVKDSIGSRHLPPAVTCEQATSFRIKDMRDEETKTFARSLTCLHTCSQFLLSLLSLELMVTSCVTISFAWLLPNTGISYNLSCKGIASFDSSAQESILRRYKDMFGQQQGRELEPKSIIQLYCCRLLRLTYCTDSKLNLVCSALLQTAAATGCISANHGSLLTTFLHVLGSKTSHEISETQALRAEHLEAGFTNNRYGSLGNVPHILNLSVELEKSCWTTMKELYEEEYVHPFHHGTDLKWLGHFAYSSNNALLMAKRDDAESKFHDLFARYPDVCSVGSFQTHADFLQALPRMLSGILVLNDLLSEAESIVLDSICTFGCFDLTHARNDFAAATFGFFYGLNIFPRNILLTLSDYPLWAMITDLFNSCRWLLSLIPEEETRKCVQGFSHIESVNWKLPGMPGRPFVIPIHISECVATSSLPKAVELRMSPVDPMVMMSPPFSGVYPFAALMSYKERGAMSHLSTCPHFVTHRLPKFSAMVFWKFLQGPMNWDVLNQVWDLCPQLHRLPNSNDSLHIVEAPCIRVGTRRCVSVGFKEVNVAVDHRFQYDVDCDTTSLERKYKHWISLILASTDNEVASIMNDEESPGSVPVADESMQCSIPLEKSISWNYCGVEINAKLFPNSFYVEMFALLKKWMREKTEMHGAFPENAPELSMIQLTSALEAVRKMLYLSPVRSLIGKCFADDITRLSAESSPSTFIESLSVGLLNSFSNIMGSLSELCPESLLHIAACTERCNLQSLSPVFYSKKEHLPPVFLVTGSATGFDSCIQRSVLLTAPETGARDANSCSMCLLFLWNTEKSQEETIAYEKFLQREDVQMSMLHALVKSAEGKVKRRPFMESSFWRSADLANASNFFAQIKSISGHIWWKNLVSDPCKEFLPEKVVHEPTLAMLVPTAHGVERTSRNVYPIQDVFHGYDLWHVDISKSLESLQDFHANATKEPSSDSYSTMLFEHLNNVGDSFRSNKAIIEAAATLRDQSVQEVDHIVKHLRKLLGQHHLRPCPPTLLHPEKSPQSNTKEQEKDELEKASCQSFVNESLKRKINVYSCGVLDGEEMYDEFVNFYKIETWRLLVTFRPAEPCSWIVLALLYRDCWWGQEKAFNEPGIECLVDDNHWAWATGIVLQPAHLFGEPLFLGNNVHHIHVIQRSSECRLEGRVLEKLRRRFICTATAGFWQALLRCSPPQSDSLMKNGYLKYIDRLHPAVKAPLESIFADFVLATYSRMRSNPFASTSSFWLRTCSCLRPPSYRSGETPGLSSNLTIFPILSKVVDDLLCLQYLMIVCKLSCGDDASDWIDDDNLAFTEMFNAVDRAIVSITSMYEHVLVYGVSVERSGGAVEEVKTQIQALIQTLNTNQSRRSLWGLMSRVEVQASFAPLVFGKCLLKLVKYALLLNEELSKHQLELFPMGFVSSHYFQSTLSAYSVTLFSLAWALRSWKRTKKQGKINATTCAFSQVDIQESWATTTVKSSLPLTNVADLISAEAKGSYRLVPPSKQSDKGAVLTWYRLHATRLAQAKRVYLSLLDIMENIYSRGSCELSTDQLDNHDKELRAYEAPVCSAQREGEQVGTIQKEGETFSVFKGRLVTFTWPSGDKWNSIMLVPMYCFSQRRNKVFTSYKVELSNNSSTVEHLKVDSEGVFGPEGMIYPTLKGMSITVSLLIRTLLLLEDSVQGLAICRSADRYEHRATHTLSKSYSVLGQTVHRIIRCFEDAFGPFLTALGTPPCEFSLFDSAKLISKGEESPSPESANDSQTIINLDPRLYSVDYAFAELREIFFVRKSQIVHVWLYPPQELKTDFISPLLAYYKDGEDVSSHALSVIDVSYALVHHESKHLSYGLKCLFDYIDFCEVTLDFERAYAMLSALCDHPDRPSEFTCAGIHLALLTCFRFITFIVANVRNVQQDLHEANYGMGELFSLCYCVYRHCRSWKKEGSRESTFSELMKIARHTLRQVFELHKLTENLSNAKIDNDLLSNLVQRSKLVNPYEELKTSLQDVADPSQKDVEEAISAAKQYVKQHSTTSSSKTASSTVETFSAGSGGLSPTTSSTHTS